MDTNDIIFKVIVNGVHTPVSDSLRFDIDYLTSEEDCTVTTEWACKTSSGYVQDILENVTLTPSVVDITEYMEELVETFLESGMTLTDLSLVEAYVMAAFGFVGDECEDIDDYYSDEFIS